MSDTPFEEAHERATEEKYSVIIVGTSGGSADWVTDVTRKRATDEAMDVIRGCGPGVKCVEIYHADEPSCWARLYPGEK